MEKRYDYSLLPHNTFGMDVKAACFVEYKSVDELKQLLATGLPVHEPVLHIGSGSNLLFAADFKGLVLHSAIKGIRVVGETDEWVDVTVGAGVVWDDFVSDAVSHGWYGAENLSLIPGEVGASAVQNIGAYGVEASDLIRFVDTVCLSSGQERRFTREECRYAYRQSIFKNELKGQYAVTYVTYRLSKHPVWHLDYGNIRLELEKEGCSLTLQHVRNAIIRIRREKLPDPQVMGNAGSFFMNPIVSQSRYEELRKVYPDMPHYDMEDGRVKIPAGWLIDRCGWKGRSLGRAAVHARQALVLVNLGGATSQEIMNLAGAVATSVKDKFGIDIHPEVNYIC